MLKTIDKIHMAGELLVGAAVAYREGKASDNDAAFARSIVLAGAAQGIVIPFLEEAGIDSSEKRFAIQLAHVQQRDIPRMTSREWDDLYSETRAFSRLIYNSLKHAGEPHWKKNAAPPSQDRHFDANLKNEADILIGSAIDDMNALLASLPPGEVVSDEARDLLQSAWGSWA